MVSNLAKIPPKLLSQAMKRQAADGDGVSHEEGPSNAKKHLYSLDDMDRIGDRLKLKDKQMRDLRTEL